MKIEIEVNEHFKEVVMKLEENEDVSHKNTVTYEDSTLAACMENKVLPWVQNKVESIAAKGMQQA